MAAKPTAKRERQREQERARARKRALRNGLFALAVVGAIGAVVALGIVAGSGGGGSGTKPSSSGELAPDFRVPTTIWSGGTDFVLSEHRGKPVVLYGIASWCFSCIAEANALGNIYREVGDQMTILVISLDPGDSEDALLNFKEVAEGGDHLWAIDRDSVFVRAFDVRALDTTLVIDPAGQVVYRDAVPTNEGTLREELGKFIEIQGGGGQPPLPGTFYPDQGTQHLQPGQTFDEYNSDPPTSGPHDPEPAEWGFYETPIPKEKLVHNLEHGGLLVLYNCPDGCPDLVEQLRRFAERYVAGGTRLIVAPYPGREKPIALVAWTYLDLLDELDPYRVAQFIAADLGAKAPEAAEFSGPLLP